MYNLGISFSNPWLLFLLIPAVVLTLFPYFRLSKKYRRTRNRILSIILHLTVMVLCIFILSGMTFSYQVSNPENEIILLVDVSDTEEQSADTRDKFIQTVLKDSKFNDYKVGIVTFGFTQEYAVPLTYDIESIFTAYQNAELPDCSATNIAAALNYTKDLFNYPETGKIILITDGKETDETADGTAVKAVTAKGIKLDAVYVSSEYSGADIQVISIEYPDYHISSGDEISIGVTLKSTAATKATQIELTDNGTAVTSGTYSLIQGKQSLTFSYRIEGQGLHRIALNLSDDNDELKENDQYCSYIYLDAYDRILILESDKGNGAPLYNILLERLEEEDQDKVKLVKLNSNEAPATLNELRQYDQIILCNVANSDLPAGFDEMLYSYVYDYGGGMFTVGGNNGEDGSDGETVSAHAYDKTDMQGTLYQEILPVQAIAYTPPVGVVIIIDRSGSMSSSSGETGESKFELAKKGAISCLNALTERDYVGIMTLDDSYEMILGMTSRTRETEIKEAIYNISDDGGSTNFAESVDRAAKALLAENVARRHIIVVTDGMNADQELSEEIADKYYQNNGITISVVGIDLASGSSAAKQMERLVELGGGRLYLASGDELSRVMREDLNVPEIKSVNYETFFPIIDKLNSSVMDGVEYDNVSDTENRLTVSLDGFYGVKIKTGAELILKGDYNIPIYAQWKFGKGTVGSFMCDLDGTWSSSFLENESGKLLITNIIDGLMPTENIRPNEISVALIEDNYTNKLSVYTDLQEGEYIDGKIIAVTDDESAELSLNEISEAESGETSYYVTASLNASNNYTRCNFVIKDGGVYRIVLNKCDAEGNIVATYEFYKAFSFSEEYDTVLEYTEEELKNSLRSLASSGGGSLIGNLDDPIEIFQNFITDLDRSFDPRFLFMIIASVLFLLDIAVRKFKFKWLHELIREHKEKKSLK